MTNDEFAVYLRRLAEKGLLRKMMVEIRRRQGAVIDTVLFGLAVENLLLWVQDEADPRRERADTRTRDELVGELHYVVPFLPDNSQLNEKIGEALLEADFYRYTAD